MAVPPDGAQLLARERLGGFGDPVVRTPEPSGPVLPGAAHLQNLADRAGLGQLAAARAAGSQVIGQLTSIVVPADAPPGPWRRRRSS